MFQSFLKLATLPAESIAFSAYGATCANAASAASKDTCYSSLDTCKLFRESNYCLWARIRCGRCLCAQATRMHSLSLKSAASANKSRLSSCFQCWLEYASQRYAIDARALSRLHVIVSCRGRSRRVAVLAALCARRAQRVMYTCFSDWLEWSSKRKFMKLKCVHTDEVALPLSRASHPCARADAPLSWVIFSTGVSVRLCTHGKFMSVWHSCSGRFV